jgi:hypothetical protein
VDHPRTSWSPGYFKPRITHSTKIRWRLFRALSLAPQSILGQRVFGSKYPLDSAPPRTCNHLAFSWVHILTYSDRSGMTLRKTTGSTCHPLIQRNNADPFHSYDLAAIERSLIAQNVVSDPSDVTYLVMQLRQLPEEARMYIIWALFFGATSVLGLLTRIFPDTRLGSK